jgi:hypothetical protein
MAYRTNHVCRFRSLAPVQGALVQATETLYSYGQQPRSETALS